VTTSYGTLFSGPNGIGTTDKAAGGAVGIMAADNLAVTADSALPKSDFLLQTQ